MSFGTILKRAIMQKDAFLKMEFRITEQATPEDQNKVNIIGPTKECNRINIQDSTKHILDCLRNVGLDPD